MTVSIGRTVWIVAGVAWLVFMVGLIRNAKNEGIWQQRAHALEGQVHATDSLRTVVAADSVRLVQLSDSFHRGADRAASSAATARAAYTQLRDSLRHWGGVATPVDSLAGDSLRELASDAHQYAQMAARALDQADRAIHAQDSEIVALRGADSVSQVRIRDLGLLTRQALAERDSARALLKPPSAFALTFEVGVGPGCASNVTQTVCGLSAQVTIFRFRLRG